MLSLSTHFVTIAAVFSINLIKAILGKPEYAIFYDGKNFQGESIFLSFDRCMNLPSSFNNKASSLDRRNNCFKLWDRECCQGKSVEMNYQMSAGYSDLSIFEFDDSLTSISPCGNYTTSGSSLFLQETWDEHNEIVDRVFEDDDVSIYYDITMSKRIEWPYQFIGDAWRYVKKTYGYFGPESGRLFSVFHAASTQKSLVQTYFDSSSDCRNVLDLSSPVKNGWKKETVEMKDTILKEMAQIVLTAYKGVHGSPAQSFWGDLSDKLVDIFVYDVYKGIGLNEESERWYNLTVNSTENFPRKEISTHWFRDWFYPIYQKHGKSDVLNNYLALFEEHFPRNPNTTYEYQGEMNFEEYVHYWSTAVGTNLRDMAAKMCGWDVTNEYQLIQAQLRFPMKYEALKK